MLKLTSLCGKHIINIYIVSTFYDIIYSVFSLQKVYNDKRKLPVACHSRRRPVLANNCYVMTLVTVYRPPFLPLSAPPLTSDYTKNLNANSTCKNGSNVLYI